MIAARQAIASPELIARVPGPWKSVTALQAALPHNVELAKGRLVIPNRGGTFELSIRPMDRDLPKIFADSNRRRPTPNELQQIQNAQAIVYAFVSIVRGASELYSLGMHAFGCRDAAVVCRNHSFHAEFLAVFLQAVALDLVPLEDGTMYVNELAGPFHVTAGLCNRVQSSSPMHNPYGQWRLTQSPLK